MNKRSITIRGHRTSFSIEDEFWHALRDAARNHDLSIAALVTRIDSERTAQQNLSSAIRLFVLRELQAAASANS